MRGEKKKIRQFENREKMLRQKLFKEERRTRSHRLIVRGAVFESIVPEAKGMTNEESATFLRLALTRQTVFYITFNPMQYIKLKYQTDEVDLFSDDDMDGDIQPIPREDYEILIEFLQDYNPPAILPIQIAYYAGLRIGEACGLAWQDVNLEEQCLTIRRSIRYDGSRHKNIIGPTKRKKVRIVDFGDTLAEILRNARKEQLKTRMQYGELYHKNYYREVKDKSRVYYEFYHLDGTENVPEDYKEISFVCLRPDGSLELPSTLGIVCRKIAQKLEGFEGFHFHQLRHTCTSNLLANGAAPKDVQELLGHSDFSTTMNVYAHSTRKAKRESARLLDKVASND